MIIKNASECLEFLDEIVSWHVHEWGEEWGEQVRESINKSILPMMFVAFENDIPVGTSLLVHEDMLTRKDLGPWMGGVFVHPNYRGKGVATQLVKQAMKQAQEKEIETLWLYTASARSIYEKVGWKYVSEEIYLGENVVIMKFQPKIDSIVG